MDTWFDISLRTIEMWEGKCNRHGPSLEPLSLVSVSHFMPSAYAA